MRGFIKTIGIFIVVLIGIAALIGYSWAQYLVFGIIFMLIIAYCIMERFDNRNK